MKLGRNSVFLAMMGLLILACGPYRAGVKESPLQEKEKVVLLDYVLTTHLNIVKHASSRLEGGQLMVQLDVENEENDDVWVDVKVIFRSAKGFEIENTDWQPFLFHRRTVTTFSRNSLSPEAEDYRILIRKIKK